MNRLNGKVAIITGATSGIGAAMADLFAAEGAKVVFIGRREDRGRAVEQEIQQAGNEATFVRGDVTVRSDVENLVAQTIEQHGRIDILVNNAGLGSAFKLHEMDVDKDFDAIFDLNIKAYFITCRLVIPHMLKQKGGSIINVSSIGSISGIPLRSSYAASKGAVNQLTRSIAVEYARDNIRCNAILPGLTTTDAVPVGSAKEKAALAIVPMERAASPREIAQAAIFFASDECPFCSGALLVIDGATTCGPVIKQQAICSNE